MKQWIRRHLLDLPEFNVFLFAFLLNLPWEFWQAPFYEEIATTPHWQATRVCTRAALGDAGMAVFAFWVMSAWMGTRSWVLRPAMSGVVGFVGVGVLLTVLFEWLATGILDRWAYAGSMPTLPLLGTGMLPLLQWILLPPLILWFAARQLA